MTVVQELRWGARNVLRRRRRSALIVGVLALALAANAVMLGVLNQLLFAEPPWVREPSRLIRIAKTVDSPGHGRLVNERLPYPDYATLVQRAPVLGVSEFAGAYTTSVSVGEGQASFRTLAAFVTASYFHVLGVTPAIGRAFAADEDEPPDGQPVVLLGHELWTRAFGASRNVLGQAMRIGDATYRIIGVLPAGFHGADQQAVELWLSLSIGGSLLHGNTWDFDANSYWIETIGRVSPGVEIQQVEPRLNATLFGKRENTQAVTARDQPVVSYRVAPLNRARGPDRPMDARVALWLAGVAAIVLVIACANVGNMHLIRSLERRAELAVRLALGATRARLAMSVVTEALILSVCAAIVSVGMAIWAGDLLVARVLGVQMPPALLMNGHLLLAMAALTTGVAILTATLPLVRIREMRLQDLLRAPSVTVGSRLASGRLMLLTMQIAMTTILLYGAGLFLKSFRAVTTIDTGFDPSQVVVVNLRQERGQSAVVLEQQYAIVARELAGDPEVERMAIGVTAPFLSGVAVRIEVPGLDSLPPETGGAIYVNAVTPDFFSTMGLRLTRGRIFDARDARTPVAVVSEQFAKTIWPEANPLGKCLHIYARSTPCRTVVGVIADPKRDKLGEEPVSQFFVPLDAAPEVASARLLFVRVRRHADEAARYIVEAVERALPHATYPRVQPLSELVSAQQRPWALGAALFVAFGLLALCISQLGLYNIIFHDVKARERELAIRVTLGANLRDLVTSVLFRTGGAVAVGLVLGLAAAYWMGLRVEPLLFRTSGVDPEIDVLIAVVTLGVAAAASAAPLWRAWRVQPAVVLRED